MWGRARRSAGRREPLRQHGEPSVSGGSQLRRASARQEAMSARRSRLLDNRPTPPHRRRAPNEHRKSQPHRVAFFRACRATAKLVHSRNPEDHPAAADHLVRGRPALAGHLSGRRDEGGVRQGVVHGRQDRAAVRPDGRLSATTPVDRRDALHGRRHDRAGTGVDGVRLAAGAGPAGQGADRRWQPRAGGNAKLPGCVAGVFGVPPRIQIRADGRSRPGALIDRRCRRRRAPAVRAAQLPEPDRPHAVHRAPRRAGGNLRRPRPAADRG